MMNKLNVRLRVRPDTRLANAVPDNMPTAPPTTKINTIVKSNPPKTKLPRKPEKEVMKMTSSDVPTAWCAGKFATSTKAGTMMNPPPTPKNPVRSPTSSPIAVILSQSFDVYSLQGEPVSGF